MAKLMLAFGLVAALAGVVGVLGIRGIGAIAASLQVLHKEYALGLANLKEAEIQLLNTSRGLSNLLLDRTAAEMEQRIANRKRYEDRFRKEFGGSQKRITASEAKAEAIEVEKLLTDMVGKEEPLVALAKEGKRAAPLEHLPEVREIVNRIEEEMEKLSEIEYDRMKQAGEAPEATYRGTRNVIVGGLVLALALAMLSGYFVAQLISRALGHVVGVTTQAAAGDLTIRAPTQSTDELGQMDRR